MKILIVDDEKALTKMYAFPLQSAGFVVVTAENGADAIVKAKSEMPSAILLDIIMPKINGLDVLKQIKETPEIKNIPIFVLTNLPEESSLAKAKSLGAEDYFVKAQTEPQEMANNLKKYFEENCPNN